MPLRYAIALSLLIPQLAAAQASDPAAASDARIREIMATARETYAIPRKPNRCERDAAPDEIVVCARDESDDYRVPPTESLNTGIPHADVGKPARTGIGVRGCFLQKCPKEVYLIDLSTIPVAPPGSDADKIARGEMRAP